MLTDSAESNTGRIQTEMYSPAIGVFNSSNVIFNITNSLTHSFWSGVKQTRIF